MYLQQRDLFGGIFVKEVLKNEKMSRWWSLAPVSITPVFWKLFGLFVKIKSIHVPVDVLKHVFNLIIIIKSLSDIKVAIVWLAGSILESPETTMFSKVTSAFI